MGKRTRSDIHIDAYQVDQICTGARVTTGQGITFAGASCDSRQVQPGQLFVALPGERTDGHHYLGDAVTAGAAVLLVMRDHPALVDAPPDVPRLEVPDTLAALQQLARWHRDRFDIPFVAVTGSNGKTTTKDMIAAALGARYHVFRTRGNLNSGIGVPLALFDLEPGCEVGVCELGTSSRGEIGFLARLVRPRYAVFTNIAPAHLETLGTIEDVATAKFELLEGLPADGLAFFCADDEILRARATRLGPRSRTFGLTADADLRAHDVRSDVDGVRFRLDGGEEVVLPVFGSHNVANSLAALSVARAMQVDTLAAVAALAVMEPAPHRSRIVHFGSATIIDDVYNANPRAVLAALEALAAYPATRRRVAVIGDMLELGEHSEPWHRQVGTSSATQALDLLVVVGTESRVLAAAARTAGMPAHRVLHFDRAVDCASDVHRWSESDDVTLLKGSRGIALEVVIAAMKQVWGTMDKEDA